MTLRLVALTDLEHFAEPAAALGHLCRLARSGTVAVVLRDRDATFRARLQLGRALREITAAAGQSLLVADRVDLALALGADGVHLPSGSLLPTQVELLFPQASITRAHHDVDALPPGEAARIAGILVSPAMAARKGRPALLAAGLRSRFSALRSLAPRALLLALGGIDDGTVGEVLAAGADGIATIAAAHTVEQQHSLVRALGIERS